MSAIFYQFSDISTSERSYCSCVSLTAGATLGCRGVVEHMFPAAVGVSGAQYHTTVTSLLGAATSLLGAVLVPEAGAGVPGDLCVLEFEPANCAVCGQCWAGQGVGQRDRNYMGQNNIGSLKVVIKAIH